MAVSVIIPNLHSPTIGEVIAALQAQTVRDQISEIIVVGRDRYGLAQSDELVRLVDTGRPVSAAMARNRGASLAVGDWLLFVDADCLLAPDALERLLAASGGYAALVGGIEPELNNYWVLANNLIAFRDCLTISLPGERGCLPSFCMLMPRDIWQQSGPFDEGFHGAAGEDLDLSFRMRRLGYRLGCEPRARVRHRPNRASPGRLWWQHYAFGASWYIVHHRYHDMLPFSQAVWINDRLRPLAVLLAVPVVCVYVLRVLWQRPALWRFWYTIPGILWAQLGWYDGIRQAACAAAQAPEERSL